MDDDLIGYLLNALDLPAHQAVEQYLERSPEARRRLALLRRALMPLGYDDEVAPPPDLVANTLRRIVAYRCRRGAPAEGTNGRDVVPLGSVGPPPSRPVRRSRWRRADVLVAASVLVLAVLLIPPAILYLRHREGVANCAHNLHLFHNAFMQYAQRPDRAGFLPRPDANGPLAVAGIYGPELRTAGCWDDAMRVNCPGVVREPCGGPPPTLEELRTHFAAGDAREWKRRVGGCYGYHFGYVDEQGHYRAIHRAMEFDTPILGDRPPRAAESPSWCTANSPNHGGYGQNVLFLGGHVRFETSRQVRNDDLYLNRVGGMAAGHGPRDAVLALSEAAPFPNPGDE